MSAVSKSNSRKDRRERPSNANPSNSRAVASRQRTTEKGTSVQTESTVGMSSEHSASLLGVGLSSSSAGDEGEGEETNSKPGNIWEVRDIANQRSTGDKTTVAGVVADKLFQRAKFVDRHNDLMYDEGEGTICKFVTSNCNLQPDINRSEWWKQARKWIPANISRLRNDKSTAMKWAFLDWLRQRSKVTTKSKHKEAGADASYALCEVIQKGRRNKTMYSIFFERFLPCVVKKSVFDQQVSVARNDNTLCTVSDEAFALLLLENSWKRWVDIYRLQKGEVTPKRGQKRREFESDVPTKYTKGGIIYDKTVKNNDPKGWSAEGIERFNQLYDMVKKDRKENKGFIKSWLTERRAKLLNGTQARRKRKRPQPQARIELMDSDSEGSGNDTASANLGGNDGTDTESCNAESD